MLSSLFDQVEGQQDIIEQYRPIEEGWSAQRIRGDRLEKELRELSVSAAPFVQFGRPSAIVCVAISTKLSKDLLNLNKS